MEFQIVNHSLDGWSARPVILIQFPLDPWLSFPTACWSINWTRGIHWAKFPSWKHKQNKSFKLRPGSNNHAETLLTNSKISGQYNYVLTHPMERDVTQQSPTEHTSVKCQHNNCHFGNEDFIWRHMTSYGLETFLYKIYDIFYHRLMR